MKSTALLLEVLAQCIKPSIINLSCSLRRSIGIASIVIQLLDGILKRSNYSHLREQIMIETNTKNVMTSWESCLMHRHSKRPIKEFLLTFWAWNRTAKTWARIPYIVARKPTKVLLSQRRTKAHHIRLPQKNLPNCPKKNTRLKWTIQSSQQDATIYATAWTSLPAAANQSLAKIKWSWKSQTGSKL